MKVQKAARELGVQFILEGSVRKAGNRVRVTAQLIDAETDGHIWAERYDRELADIFVIQDELTTSIVGTLPGRVEAARHERVKRKPPENMAAYELVLSGKRCTIGPRAPITRKRCVCSNARSNSIRNSRMRMPGAPASSAKPGLMTGAKTVHRRKKRS